MLEGGFERFVPRFGGRSFSVRAPWWNRRLSVLRIRKNSCYKNFLKHRSQYHGMKFCHARSKFHTINMYFYNIFLMKTEINLKANPKAFWGYVNCKRKVPGIPISLSLGNATTTSPQASVNLFAKMFSQVFNYNQVGNYSSANSTNPIPAIPFQKITISVEEVQTALASRNR